MSTNYFKAGATIVPFDDTSLASVNAAFVEICRYDAPKSVWRLPRWAGAWDSVNIIGHRSRRDILIDIKAYGTCKEELQALDVAAGRTLYEAS